ncbi:GHMP kinase [Methanobrevibacter sp. TMH8]|uniref:pantoate kinase n=1 Tax=Methanobrevibacter sp. TMH8 TaxID=2848611 RepID=UPI001CCFCFE3|nr:pantoate kinase [Methanobrevibacter sp. TMH8]MBZ9571506.1 GHMP kinase [Methanobrevibacter sp. TMH8]
MEVSVFVPAHITGFFSIYNDENPLKKGSCGAGVLINKGVITTIKTNEKKEKYGKKEKSSINITINGKKDPKNEIISKETISLIQREFKFELNSDININHEIQIPIGSGFGTSASCALGVSIGLSKLLKLPLTDIEASQFAHIAEVNLGSGLGDVLSQTSKGIVFRKFPGAPGVGKTEEGIKPQNNGLNDIYVLTKTFGEIDTSSIIQNPLYSKKINNIGLAMQEKMIVEPTLENFIKLSYEFSKKTGLMNKEIQDIVEELNKKTIGSSMAMLGNTVFAFVKKEDIDNIKNLNDFTISKIYNDGIKIEEY